MNYGPEKRFTQDLTALLVGCGTYVMPMVGSEMQPAGYPDRFVAHRLWSGWLELKVGGNVMSGPQRECIRRLAERGQRAMCLALRGAGKNLELRAEWPIGVGGTVDVRVGPWPPHNGLGADKPGHVLLRSLELAWEWYVKRGK